MEKYVTVSEYVTHFGLIVLSGYSALNEKKISDFVLSRPGFELCGYFSPKKVSRIVCIGNKEMEYINQCNDHDLLNKAYDWLTQDFRPCIVVTCNNDCPSELLNIAKNKNFPVLLTSMRTAELSFATFSYLQEVLAPSMSMHASLVEMYSLGVLITGESGIGKSETTLDLIKKGHRLVADDRVNIAAVKGELIGSSPDITYGIMEARGIGLIDIAKMFGINSLLKKKQIFCMIKLVDYNSFSQYDRLGNQTEMVDILGVRIPQIVLPVSGGRSIAEMIEVAVTNLKLKASGVDSTFEFEKRMDEVMSKDRDNKYDY